MTGKSEAALIICLLRRQLKRRCKKHSNLRKRYDNLLAENDRLKEIVAKQASNPRNENERNEHIPSPKMVLVHDAIDIIDSELLDLDLSSSSFCFAEY